MCFLAWLCSIIGGSFFFVGVLIFFDSSSNDRGKDAMFFVLCSVAASLLSLAVKYVSS